jgi:hypothetical protein
LGRFILSGPELLRVPSHLEGLYVILLRIEAVDDANGSGGATGGVAGFSMPVLRYYVGASTGQIKAQGSALSPADNASVSRDALLEFTWPETQAAVLYRVEIYDAEDKVVLSAVLPAAIRSYRAPSWLPEKLGGRALKWRVLALDPAGRSLSESPVRRLRFD